MSNEIRQAASLIGVRDGSDGPEVLVIERALDHRFLPGYVAFPGGAIDPTDGVLHAPCDGEVISVAAASHAIALRATNGAEILLHVGIDTVALAGDGFKVLVSAGARVRSGEPGL